MTIRANNASPRTKALIAVVLLSIGVLWALIAPWRSASAPSSKAATPTKAVVSAPIEAPAIAFRKDAQLVPTSVDDEQLDRGLTPLPTPTAPVRERVLLDAKYGDGDDMLDMQCPAPGYDGLCYPPQGFAVTPEGKLVIVDTKKVRLSFFDTEGHMERSIPLAPHLVMPADVAIARDGTIAVVDTEGVQTKGSVLIKPDGTIKALLGQMGGGLMTGLYAVGNDYFARIGGLTSIKVGDSGGTPNDETPDLYDQDGIVPGHVAPDGRTIVSASIHDVKAGELLVSVIKNDPPEHVFSRLYSVGNMLTIILHAQSDAAGMIHVVLYQALEKTGLITLACFDGTTGDPRGHVVLPMDQLEGGGEPFHNYNVLPTGGIVQQQVAEDRSTYRFFSCN